MKYLLADKEKALACGFMELTHRSNDYVMLLNEKELRDTPALSGTIKERATALDATLMTQAETFAAIKTKGRTNL